MPPADSIPTERRRSLITVVLSLAVHGALLSCLIFVPMRSGRTLLRPANPIPVAMVEVAGSSHKLPIPLPTSPNLAHTRNPVPNTDSTQRTILPVPPQAQKYSGGGQLASTRGGKGSGHVLPGNGDDDRNAQPAFPIFSPHPPVSDRSLLPASEEKIVVDVAVDALGGVTSETLVKGLGNQLDQIVLDTVKTWRFQPATIDGKPVPTEAELVFPFNRAYPITRS